MSATPVRPWTKPAIDMRAEVVSRPTPAMWDAMREAEIDWYVSAQDPYVNELEARMATMTGKESAFFVATGALANLLGILELSTPGTQAVMESRCHMYWAEGNNSAFIGRVATRLVDGDRFGRIDPEQLERVLAEAKYGYPQTTSLLCLENTHNITGGCPLPAAETAELAAVAHAHGARVFVDGARLWNAAVACQTTFKDLLAEVDGAMISLNKGLGAPVGAVLVGDEDMVNRARVTIRRLAVSGFHRMGYFAAAALCALDTMQDVFIEDHRRARKLAEGLAAIDGIDVDLDTVQTNIVRLSVNARGLDAWQFAEELLARGVGARVLEEPNIVKFHTYWEISDDHIEAVIAAVADVVESP